MYSSVGAGVEPFCRGPGLRLLFLEAAFAAVCLSAKQLLGWRMTRKSQALCLL